MRWKESWRSSPVACDIADRHYSRQSIGYPDCAPPGRCVVLTAISGSAYWITSWPFAEYVKHAWAGSWSCSAFRNEGAGLSSELILEAIAATRWVWPEIPDLGMITFVDPKKVAHKRDPGRCFLKAGFRPAICPEHGLSRSKTAKCKACQSRTKGGLLAFQMMPEAMPDPIPPVGSQGLLFSDYCIHGGIE